MRKSFAVIIAVILYPLISFAGPKVVIPETHWDFGYVPQNTTISHPYWIKNIGDDTLKIISVRPG